MVNVVPIAVKRTVGRRARTREHLLVNEVEKLIQVSRRNRYGHRDSTLILILFTHGLRVSEGLQARWQQFDLEQGIFHVHRLKGSLSGDHRLRGVEIRALRRLRKDGPVSPEFVFASERGGRYSSCLTGFRRGRGWANSTYTRIASGTPAGITWQSAGPICDSFSSTSDTKISRTLCGTSNSAHGVSRDSLTTEITAAPSPRSALA
jgi:integrase